MIQLTQINIIFKKDKKNKMNNIFQDLDALQLLAFYIQLKNIEFDQDQNQYIHSVIQNINTEIAKLHKQNDIIMKQNKDILSKLDNK